MRRREFVTVLGGAAVWPLAVRAQQPDRMRNIGVLMNLAEEDPFGRAELTAFTRGLQQLGWADGRNVRIDTRYADGDADRIRKNAAEMAALAPDVILAVGASTGAMLQASRTVPIVFVIIPDPVGAGLVDSLAHPGGNATGFTGLEYGTSGKWLELLKEIAPHTTHVAVLRDTFMGGGLAQLGAIQAVAPSFGVVLTPVGVSDAREIERGITSVAGSSNGGLVVTSSPFAAVHRDLIVRLAASHKLPAVYFNRLFTDAGGLISFGQDYNEDFRQAAGYVDRILKGEKPADMPVQAPTKFELVINLKTAKALGLTVPPTLITAATEVIE